MVENNPIQEISKENRKFELITDDENPLKVLIKYENRNEPKWKKSDIISIVSVISVTIISIGSIIYNSYIADMNNKELFKTKVYEVTYNERRKILSVQTNYLLDLKDKLDDIHGNTANMIRLCKNMIYGNKGITKEYKKQIKVIDDTVLHQLYEYKSIHKRIKSNTVELYPFIKKSKVSLDSLNNEIDGNIYWLNLSFTVFLNPYSIIR